MNPTIVSTNEFYEYKWDIVITSTYRFEFRRSGIKADNEIWDMKIDE